MSVELPFVLGGSGGVLISFGAFLVLYEKYEYCVGGCKLGRGGRSAAWTLLVLGVVLLLAAFWLHWGTPRPLKPFPASFDRPEPSSLLAQGPDASPDRQRRTSGT